MTGIGLLTRGMVSTVSILPGEGVTTYVRIPVGRVRGRLLLVGRVRGRVMRG